MKERNYGIDLLKIILAFMVIIIHINANGTGQVLSHTTLQPWKSLVTLVTFACYPAVNTYILITGFYSYEANKGLNNIVKSLSILWLSVMFFSLFGYFVGIIFGNSFQFLDFVKRFFPITRGVYWFYTVYFALLLLSPFINKMLNNIDVGGHRMLLIVLLIMLSILPMFVNWEGQIGSNYGYSLVWFLALYITGAFLQRKRILINKNPKKVLFYLMFFGVSTIALYVIPKTVGLVGISLNLAMYNSVVVYTQAICLFMAFGNIRPAKYFEKIISCISRLALASYLLHCQEDIEKILWANANPSAYANSSKIILVAVIICMAMFITGSILEYMRKQVCKLTKIDKWFARNMSKGYLLLETSLKEKED